MHNGHGYTPSRSTPSRRTMRDVAGPATPPSRPTTTTTGGGWSPGVGGQQHIPKPRVQTGGDGTLAGGGIKNYLTQLLTGKHFGETGNRQKLINAMKLGLIDERQYKLMSGYDASKEIGLTPLSTGVLSGAYNIGKRIGSPEDFEGKIGPLDSTMLNVQGSKGEGFDMDQYSGIVGLSPESLTTDPTGPYGSNYESRLSQFAGAPAYDFANGGLAYLLYGGLV